MSSLDDTRESTIARSKGKKTPELSGSRKTPKVKPVENTPSPPSEFATAADADAQMNASQQPSPEASSPTSRPGEPQEGGASAEEQAPQAAGFQQPAQLGAAPCIACFAALIILVFAAVVALKFALPLWPPEDADRHSAFCCPEEVKALASYVDNTVDPCSSFFDFVCSKIVQQRTPTDSAVSSVVPPPSLISNLEHDALTASGGSKNWVSAFLRSLFASCMSAAALDENAAFLELADFLVAVGAASHLRDLNLTSAFAYLFLTNLKYRVTSVVSVTWRRAGAIEIAHRPRKLGDVLNSAFQQSIVESTRKMKKITNRETKSEDVTACASELLASYPKEMVRKRYAGANALDLLQRWHMQEAFRMAAIDIGNVIAIDVDGSHHVDAFVRVVSSLNETSADRTSAYILACSLHDAFVDLQWPSGGSERERLSFCLRRLDSMPNLRSLMYLDAFGTDERVKQVTRVINTVVGTIATDFESSLSLNREDVPRLKAFFGRISLAHPSARNGAHVRKFNSNHSFRRTLLEGRSYELQQKMNLARVGLPFTEPGPGVDYHYLHVHNAEKVVLSPALYALVRTDPTHTDVFNTPVVGLAVAEAIWKYILKNNTFLSYAARDSIETLAECFRRKYLTTYEDELKCVDGSAKCVDDLDTVAAGLALSSVLRTFREPRWHRVEAAWPPWSLSHAQFFYLRETFYRCPASPVPRRMRDHVDVPLMYVEDFSAAFQCRRSDPMSMAKMCAIGARST